MLAGIGPTREVAGHVTANLTAYHDSFLAAAAVAVIAAVALTVHDAAAMVRRRRHGVAKQAEHSPPRSTKPAGRSGIPHQPRKPHPSHLHQIQSARIGLTWRLSAVW
jgi:hypothetical protein